MEEQFPMNSYALSKLSSTNKIGDGGFGFVYKGFWVNVEQ